MEVSDWEYQRIVERLKEWAVGHPNGHQPFMTMMDETTVELTPMDFVREVQRGTEIGSSYVRYLEEMSRANEEDLVASINRAIEANRIAP